MCFVRDGGLRHHIDARKILEERNIGGIVLGAAEWKVGTEVHELAGR